MRDSNSAAVYPTPLVRPLTTVDVPGGDPGTTVVGWAVVPTNGVTE